MSDYADERAARSGIQLSDLSKGIPLLNTFSHPTPAQSILERYFLFDCSATKRKTGIGVEWRLVGGEEEKCIY